MLQGKRVTLRAVEREDLSAWWKAGNDLEIELLGGGDPPMPASLAHHQSRFDAEEAKEVRDRDRLAFAIETEGQLIGGCELRDFDHTAHHCSLGIVIHDREYWGRGYGREAVELLLEYAFRHRHLNRVWLDVRSDNERAIRSYLACGFVEEGRMRQHSWSDGRYKDNVVMSVLRDEWLARKPASETT